MIIIYLKVKKSCPHTSEMFSFRQRRISTTAQYICVIGPLYAVSYQSVLLKWAINNVIKDKFGKWPHSCTVCGKFFKAQWRYNLHWLSNWQKLGLCVYVSLEEDAELWEPQADTAALPSQKSNQKH